MCVGRVAGVWVGGVHAGVTGHMSLVCILYLLCIYTVYCVALTPAPVSAALTGWWRRGARRTHHHHQPSTQHSRSQTQGREHAVIHPSHMVTGVKDAKIITDGRFAWLAKIMIFTLTSQFHVYLLCFAPI